MGGMVLETNMTEIMTRIEEQNRLEKSEVGSGNRLLSLTYNRSMFFFGFIFTNRNLHYSILSRLTTSQS